MKSSQIATLDRLFSEIIRLRANGFCEHCNLWYKYEGINPSYYFGRASKNLRWDENNVQGLCNNCHMLFTWHKSLYTSWLVNRIGIERFDKLVLTNNTIQKLDYNTIKAQLQERLKELEGIRGV